MRHTGFRSTVAFTFLLGSLLSSMHAYSAQTFEKRINSNMDDVEEKSNGRMYTTSSDLELTYDGNEQTVGLRYTRVTIPQGATITNAYVQFTTDETNSGATSLTIRAEDENNASAFSESRYNVSSRRQTAAAVNWQPAAWNSVGSAGSDQRTPNLKSLVQEVVNRSGWNSGNSLVLMVTGSGERTAESHNGSSSKAPLLHIDYTIESTGDPTTGDPTTGDAVIIEKRISNNLDDVEESSSGNINTGSSDVELVYDGSNQTVGLRFTRLSIPQGVSISKAYLQFTVDETNSGSTSLTIRGEDRDDASAFNTSRRNVSNRAKTSASVNWQPRAWNTVGAAGRDQRSPDLKNIIQEITNRGGWNSGNDIVLMITGSGERTAESHNGSSSKAPLLHIEYIDDGSSPAPDPEPETGGIKIAFIGDTGAGSNFQSVLNLIKAEGAELTIVAGDTSYNSSKDDNWDSMVRNTLGSDPALIAAGNHDYGDSNINDVISYGKSRLNNQNNVQCTGRYAEQMTCQLGNVHIVLSAIGASGNRSDHESYITNSLNDAPNGDWRICAWHKNQRDMQVGGKSDEVGWTAYETCRQQGAIISTGHEHSYSRTHLLSDMSSQQIASTSSNFTVEEGKTFAFVSGLGGIGTRDQERNGDWWASIYTSTQGARYGAMFATFYDDYAEFYFKTINGEIIDQFTVNKGY
jgi:hypothetical protein